MQPRLRAWCQQHRGQTILPHARRTCHGPALLARGRSHRAVVGCGARVRHATRAAGALHVNRNGLRSVAAHGLALPFRSPLTRSAPRAGLGQAQPPPSGLARPSHYGCATRLRPCATQPRWRGSAPHVGPQPRVPAYVRRSRIEGLTGAPAPRVSCPPSRAPHPPPSRCLRLRARTRRSASRAPSGRQKHCLSPVLAAAHRHRRHHRTRMWRQPHANSTSHVPRTPLAIPQAVPVWQEGVCTVTDSPNTYHQPVGSRETSVTPHKPLTQA